MTSFVHNILLVIQWLVFVTGTIAAIPLGFLFGIDTGILSCLTGIVALGCLKLEVLSFAGPRR